MKLTGRRILLVEDEPIIAMTAEDMLLELGAEIVGPAATLQEALKLAGDGGFDAALLDINLAGERSYPVADLLHKQNVPFVFATGYSSPGSKDHSGADILQKPYSQERIAIALAKAIAKGRA